MPTRITMHKFKEDNHNLHPEMIYAEDIINACKKGKIIAFSEEYKPGGLVFNTNYGLYQILFYLAEQGKQEEITQLVTHYKLNPSTIIASGDVHISHMAIKGDHTELALELARTYPANECTETQKLFAIATTHFSVKTILRLASLSDFSAKFTVPLERFIHNAYDKVLSIDINLPYYIRNKKVDTIIADLFRAIDYFKYDMSQVDLGKLANASNVHTIFTKNIVRIYDLYASLEGPNDCYTVINDIILSIQDTYHYAALNHPFKDNKTPLEWCCEKGHVRSAAVILKHGGDCNTAINALKNNMPAKCVLWAAKGLRYNSTEDIKQLVINIQDISLARVIIESYLNVHPLLNRKHCAEIILRLCMSYRLCFNGGTISSKVATLTTHITINAEDKEYLHWLCFKLAFDNNHKDLAAIYFEKVVGTPLGNNQSYMRYSAELDLPTSVKHFAKQFKEQQQTILEQADEIEQLKAQLAKQRSSTPLLTQFEGIRVSRPEETKSLSSIKLS